MVLTYYGWVLCVWIGTIFGGGCMKLNYGYVEEDGPQTGLHIIDFNPEDGVLPDLVTGPEGVKYEATAVPLDVRSSIPERVLAWLRSKADAGQVLGVYLLHTTTEPTASIGARVDIGIVGLEISSADVADDWRRNFSLPVPPERTNILTPVELTVIRKRIADQLYEAGESHSVVSEIIGVSLEEPQTAAPELCRIRVDALGGKSLPNDGRRNPYLMLVLFGELLMGGTPIY